MSNIPTTPQPYPSWTWVVNEIGHGFWQAPKACPNEDQVVYYWDELSLDWKIKS
jgi:hypothetical protein